MGKVQGFFDPCLCWFDFCSTVEIFEMCLFLLTEKCDVQTVEIWWANVQATSSRSSLVDFPAAQWVNCEIFQQVDPKKLVGKKDFVGICVISSQGVRRVGESIFCVFFFRGPIPGRPEVEGLPQRPRLVDLEPITKLVNLERLSLMDNPVTKALKGFFFFGLNQWQEVEFKGWVLFLKHEQRKWWAEGG